LVAGEDDVIYRYDGVTGELRAVWRHADLTSATADGAYFEGLEGGITLVRWDGRAERIECGPGKWGRLSAAGTCASFAVGADRSLWVRDTPASVPRLVLPADWGLSDARWTSDARSLVLLRSQAGTTPATRAHNALWLMAPDGALRRVYEPASPESFLSGLRVSPEGRFALVSEMPIVSASVGGDGVVLLLRERSRRRARRSGETVLRPRSDRARGDRVRPSADGRSSLILARRPTDQPGDQYRQLELWLLRDIDGAAKATRLISNLGGLGFGYYGLQPSLFDLVAWSLDPR